MGLGEVLEAILENSMARTEVAAGEHNVAESPPEPNLVAISPSLSTFTGPQQASPLQPALTSLSSPHFLRSQIQPLPEVDPGHFLRSL